MADAEDDDPDAEDVPVAPPLPIHVSAIGRGMRWGPWGFAETRRCSFCGRREQSAVHLVRSRAAVICDRCVSEISALVAGLPADQRNVRFKPALAAPADREAAELAIEAVYERVFDDAVPVEERAAGIEQGENLAASIAEAGSRAPGRGGVDVFVEFVRFIAEDEAEVRFMLSLGGSPVPQLTETGHAVLTDDGWRMARSTWCGLAIRVGVQCPPPAA